MLASLVFYRVFSVACRFAGFVAFTTYVPSVIRLWDGAYLNGSLVVFVVRFIVFEALKMFLSHYGCYAVFALLSS